MRDLEHELTALAKEIDWPAAPDTVHALRSVVATPRHAGPRGERVARRLFRQRRIAAALVVLVVAVAAAFAVPQSRGAILRFLHLGGVSIQLVDRLPPAEERPLGAGLGPTVSIEAARAKLGGLLLVPPLAPLPPLHGSDGVISLLFLDRDEPVLLSELYAPGGYLLKKIVAAGTRVSSVKVGTADAVWLSDGEHLFLAPSAPARLAGNVLLWQRGDLTLRLEGRDLSLRRAQELALALG